jgi:hypothetical protein
MMTLTKATPYPRSTHMALPGPIIAVLAAFEPLFTHPTWQRVLVLVLGTLLGHGRRTVTAALRQMGYAHDPHASSFHQVLNRARWSPLAVSRTLLRAGIATFLPADAPLLIVVDETLERRWGRHIRKRGHYRDPLLSGKGLSVCQVGDPSLPSASLVSCSAAMCYAPLTRSVRPVCRPTARTPVRLATQTVRSACAWYAHFAAGRGGCLRPRCAIA